MYVSMCVRVCVCMHVHVYVCISWVRVYSESNYKVFLNYFKPVPPHSIGLSSKVVSRRYVLVV